MADLLIKPGRLTGSIEPPPSKSDAHRALIAAWLAGDLQGSGISGMPEVLPDDLAATCRCLAALAAGRSELDCGESGTTLRLLIPVTAALDLADRASQITFLGSGRLPQRPIDAYRTVLGDAGAQLDFAGPDSLPLTLSGRIRAGLFQLPGHISSQYLSGLLFALPLLPGDSQIVLTTPLESAPYVAMTLRTLTAFGIVVHETEQGYDIPGSQTYRRTAYRIEKDYSQAAFWLTANYLGSNLQVSGLSESSVQGDKVIEALLADFRLVRPAYCIDAAQIPDLVPILAVAAAATPSVTRIIRAARLRLKESDRLESTAMALSALGADVVVEADGLLIRGGAGLKQKATTPLLLRGGEVDTLGDHRIAMAAAIAALNTRQGVVLHRSEAVRKSYPAFFDDFKRLGGNIHELDLGQ